jgi:hypothetical protein
MGGADRLAGESGAVRGRELGRVGRGGGGGGAGGAGVGGRGREVGQK